MTANTEEYFTAAILHPTLKIRDAKVTINRSAARGLERKHLHSVEHEHPQH
jgi:hypothetical protein